MHSSVIWVEMPEHGSVMPENKICKLVGFLLKTVTFLYCPNQTLPFFHGASLAVVGLEEIPLYL